MPTPDHRYVIELGLASKRLACERMELIQYKDVMDEVKTSNPSLEEMLVLQKQKRLVDNYSYVPTAEDSAMLDYILWENRSSKVDVDPATGKTVVREVVDLRDPDYGSDTSIFAKPTYDDALLAAEQDRLAALHAFAALLVLITGGLLAITVSRRVSRPSEQLVADVDVIAGGDLNHAIRPVALVRVLDPLGEERGHGRPAQGADPAARGERAAVYGPCPASPVGGSSRPISMGG